MPQEAYTKKVGWFSSYKKSLKESGSVYHEKFMCWADYIKVQVASRHEKGVYKTALPFLNICLPYKWDLGIVIHQCEINRVSIFVELLKNIAIILQKE